VKFSGEILKDEDEYVLEFIVLNGNKLSFNDVFS